MVQKNGKDGRDKGRAEEMGNQRQYHPVGARRARYTAMIQIAKQRRGQPQGTNRHGNKSAEQKLGSAYIGQQRIEKSGQHTRHFAIFLFVLQSLPVLALMVIRMMIRNLRLSDDRTG